MLIEKMMLKPSSGGPSGFLSDKKPISLPPIKKRVKDVKTYTDRTVYGFGPLNSENLQIGGSFYFPKDPQYLNVKGAGLICGLDETKSHIEEQVSNAETKNLFYRVTSVVGDAEVCIGSAILAKTDRGSSRSPIWSTGEAPEKMSDIFIHTRAENAEIQLVFVSQVTGKSELMRLFYTDLAQFKLPDVFVIPPFTDVLWFGRCARNGGWASISYVINSTYAR